MLGEANEGGTARSLNGAARVRGLESSEEYTRLWRGMFSHYPEYYIALYRNDPRSLPEHSRVVEVDEEIVTHVRIYDRDVRVGDAVCRVGAIGDVQTLESHRKKGYARMALNDAIRTMNRYGMDFCTILSGVGVYERTGWSAFCEDQYAVPVQAPRVKGPEDIFVRRVEIDRDLPRLIEVHEAFGAGRSLNVVRSRAYWRTHFNWVRESPESFFVAERDNQIVAYVRSSPSGETLNLLEACYVPDQADAVASLCDVLLRFARRRRAMTLQGVLPRDHALVDLFSAHEGMQHTRPQVLLLRLVNLRRFLGRIRPALQRRLTSLEEKGAIDPSDPRNDLDLEVSVAGETASLKITSGVVSCGVGRHSGESPGGVDRVGAGRVAIPLSQERFFQLFLGMRPASELQLEEELSTAQIKLLESLTFGAAPIYWRTDGV